MKRKNAQPKNPADAKTSAADLYVIWQGINKMPMPTLEKHAGKANNRITFLEAVELIQSNKNYVTSSGKQFTAEAKKTTKGNHKGKITIIFLRNGKESARAYECCWGHITNCNNTYINMYTEKL